MCDIAFAKNIFNIFPCPRHCASDRILDIDIEAEFGYERENLKQTTMIETAFVIETGFVFESVFDKEDEAEC